MNLVLHRLRLRQIAELDININAISSLVAITVEQFRMAALAQDPHAADKCREEVMYHQGHMMDMIYARVSLMREAGLLP